MFTKNMRYLICDLIVIIALEILSVNCVYKECGIQGTFSKILGGEYTTIDEFPWIALLGFKSKRDGKTKYSCSGTIIDEQVILTAGHCMLLDSISYSLYTVRLGEYDLSQDKDCTEVWNIKDCADPPQNILIDHYLVHPEFDNGFNDIALIFLKQKIKFTDFVQPICLPDQHYFFKSDDFCVVSGWGRTENGTLSDIKLKVSVPIRNFSDCYKKYRYEEGLDLDKSRHICAGESERDTCTGDSGSPLMTTKGGDPTRWKIVALTSRGRGCGKENWPGIYTRVSFYLNWINYKIRKFKQRE